MRKVLSKTPQNHIDYQIIQSTIKTIELCLDAINATMVHVGLFFFSWFVCLCELWFLLLFYLFVLFCFVLFCFVLFCFVLFLFLFSIISFVSFILMQTPKAEQTREILSIQDRLISKQPIILVKTGRDLKLSGVCVYDKSRLELFLFTDLLLGAREVKPQSGMSSSQSHLQPAIARTRSLSIATFKSATSSTPRDPSRPTYLKKKFLYYLSKLTVVTKEKKKDKFAIYFSTADGKSDLLYFHTEIEQTMWYDEITACWEAVKRDSSPLPSPHLSKKWKQCDLFIVNDIIHFWHHMCQCRHTLNNNVCWWLIYLFDKWTIAVLCMLCAVCLLCSYGSPKNYNYSEIN